MVKIACQANLFGNPNIKDKMGEIAAAIKEAGFEGIEIGARHFYPDRIGFYQDLFKKADIKLIALSTGFSVFNKDQIPQQADAIKSAIRLGKNLGCFYIFVSGGFQEGKNREHYLAEAEHYKELGRICSGEGMKLCYHNHHYEFFNNGEGIKILLDKVPEDLMKLVPDLGWVEVGKASAAKFVKENASRIEVLHFQDFKALPGGEVESTQVGTGIVPFKEVYKHIENLLPNCWIVAEQEKTYLDPKESARLDYNYINDLRS